MQKPTRMLRKKERQTLRNIIITVTALIVVIVLFFMYGIQMLINFSLYLDKMKNKSVDTNASDAAFIAPPMINPMFSATNTAEINLSGYSLPNNTVKLYVNDHLAGSQAITDNKSFTFQHVSLHDGENDIKAKTVTQTGKESDFSEVTKVTLQNKAPNLTVDAPQDGQTVSNDQNPFKVTGKTDSSINVKINDYWAIVDDQGNFSYILPLQKGDNHLHVVASDDAGNQTTKDVKVTLNQ